MTYEPCSPSLETKYRTRNDRDEVKKNGEKYRNQMYKKRLSKKQNLFEVFTRIQLYINILVYTKIREDENGRRATVG